jgi:hypothetical protein
MVCQWFDLKTTVIVSHSLISKPVATVFPGLTSKPVVGGGVSNLGFKTGSYDLVIWVSKSL